MALEKLEVLNDAGVDILLEQLLRRIAERYVTRTMVLNMINNATNLDDAKAEINSQLEQVKSQMEASMEEVKDLTTKAGLVTQDELKIVTDLLKDPHGDFVHKDAFDYAVTHLHELIDAISTDGDYVERSTFDYAVNNLYNIISNMSTNQGSGSSIGAGDADAVSRREFEFTISGLREHLNALTQQGTNINVNCSGGVSTGGNTSSEGYILPFTVYPLTAAQIISAIEQAYQDTDILGNGGYVDPGYQTIIKLENAALSIGSNGHLILSYPDGILEADFIISSDGHLMIMFNGDQPDIWIDANGHLILRYDDSGSTDTTSSIEDAVVSISNNGHLTVTFPGTELDTTLAIDSNGHLVVTYDETKMSIGISGGHLMVTMYS